MGSKSPTVTGHVRSPAFMENELAACTYGSGCNHKKTVPATTRRTYSRLTYRLSPLMALQRRLGRGKASRLCPCSSDVDLFGYGESVVDLNAEIAHRALNLLVPQQQLNGPQVASAAVDECRLGSAQ